MIYVGTDFLSKTTHKRGFISRLPSLITQIFHLSSNEREVDDRWETRLRDVTLETNYFPMGAVDYLGYVERDRERQRKYVCVYVNELDKM